LLRSRAFGLRLACLISPSCGNIMPAVPAMRRERSVRFRGSKGRPFRTEDALCSAEVTWTNWWPWTRGRPFRFISRRILPAVRSGRIRSGSRTCCLLRRNGSPPHGAGRRSRISLDQPSH
jgi:hypothetical protein